MNSDNDKMQELDLLSSEKLDRSSPELWMQSNLENDVSKLNNGTSLKVTNGTTSKWMSDLNKEDIELLNELATLSQAQLMDKVKDLMEIAYQLGEEESHQMTRSKLLNILDNLEEA